MLFAVMCTPAQYSQYFQELDHVAQQLYKAKLQMCVCTKLDPLPDPYVLPKELWTTNPSDWPDVQFGDIYNYLIFKTGMSTHCSKQHNI